MFGRIYKGELKKIVRPGAMIALCVVLALILLIYAIVYNLISSFTLDVTDLAEGDGFSQEIAISEDEYYKYTPDDVSQSLIDEQNYLQLLQKEAEESDTPYNYYASLFSVQANIVALKFIQKNNLYNTPLRILGVNYSPLSDTTAESFAGSYMSIAAAVLLIYGIVVGAGLLADEYKSGTIKLLLSRPIGKNQLISAKLLAALTVSVGLFSIFTLIAYVYGAVAFSSNSAQTVYMVFNAQSVIRSSVGGYIFANYVSSVVQIVLYTLLAYFIGTFFRKKTAGIIISLFVAFGLVSGILSLTPVQIASLSCNTDLLCYFDASAQVPNYGNFFISLVVLVVYFAIITFGLYFTVNKRDVI